jgi:hypothetical protein
MEKKMEIEKSFYERENKMSQTELETTFRLEKRLFQNPDNSAFNSPLQNINFLQLQIKSNLDKIILTNFNPISKIKNQVTTSCGRIIPHFHKLFSNLGSEGVNPLTFPIEAIFITLSKSHWNSTQKLKKQNDVLKICDFISGGNITVNESELRDLEIEDGENDSFWNGNVNVRVYEKFLLNFINGKNS